MTSRASAKILFFLIFILVASSCIRPVSVESPTLVEQRVNEILPGQSTKDPHSEPGRTYFQLITVANTPIPKTEAPFYFEQSFACYNSGISLENLKIKKSSLLIKEYLSRIYPSHNFW